ncbi:MAG: hypothetical protein A2085_05350 [Gemmatimonadetes bacterium GWC2_71_10]|nr:MAG: hypothetical protein A2085_05350 [Gemmatimonadetes bacterium GWC2_71_10]
MKRYPAFDPPEYVNWKPDPTLVDAFDAATRADAERGRLVRALDQAFLLELYAGLLRARLHDVTLKRWVRTGVISKAWLGTGEEAATVGPVHALDRATDIVAPMIRNAGACREMGEPIAESLKSYLGTADSSSRGRDGHHGNMKYNVLQPISHVGDMVPVVTGIALAARMRGTAAQRHGGTEKTPVTLTWIGDGTVKAGATHEGFNFAAVQRVPAIFIVQNNQVALGTRFEQHHAAPDFHELPDAYGMAGGVCDGNNVLDAWAATKLAAERCRGGEGPVMLIAETFRMGGHATHDEREARETFPAEWFAEWGRKDPIGLYEEWLKRQGIAVSRLEQVEAEVEAEVAAAEAEALRSRETKMPAGASALEGVYAH